MAANPIFVETEEEIPAVIERIKSADASEVPLVLPTRSRFGQSRFNFQLLRDYAVRMGKRVSIISADPAVQRMAEESGFPAYRAVDQYATIPEAPAADSIPPVAVQPPPPQNGEAARAPLDVAPAPAPVAPAQVIPLTPPPVTPPPATPSPAVTPRPQPPIRVVSADAAANATGAGRRPRIKITPPRTLPSRLATESKPSRIILYAGALLVLVVGLVAMVVYVPSAKVRLVADAQPFNTTAEIAAEPSKPPIRVRTASVTKEAKASQKATGVKTIPGAVAKGAVVFDSRPCGAILGRGFTVTIFNGTRLQGPGGVEFATNGGDVVIQGPSQAQAAIVATKPGAAGNVAPGPFSFAHSGDESANCVAAHTDGPTAGGTDEQKKTVVSTADVDAVRSSLDQQLRRQATDDLDKQVQPGEKLADPPVVATPEFATDHRVDDEAGSFNATMKLTSEGAFYSADDVTRAFTDALAKKVPADQQLTSNKPKVDSQITAASAGGHLTFRGSASGYVAPKIDLNQVKGQLPGKPTARVRTDLARLPVHSVDVQQYPVKLPIMPLAGSRISLEYDVEPAAVAPPG